MKKIDKILIANRSEIAERIMRTAERMSIQTVAIFSKYDADLPFVARATTSVLLHGDSLAETYLNISQIIQIALDQKVDAVHPGYGFLSENTLFAQAVNDAGLIWIGPQPQIIELLGNKVRAREQAKQFGLPILPALVYDDSLSLSIVKKEIGFPLLIKAAAGGGGKGMKIVQSETDFSAMLESAKREALLAFGNDQVYLEKYLERPRHIEVQILGDQFGNLVHLGERECSIQRRYQKIIEESPSPELNAALRKEICELASRFASSLGYYSACTVEFIYQDQSFYFLEVNTRLQVEHPVTEEICGLDIVAEQINIAAGQKLIQKQDQIDFHGYAIELRICAENPQDHFSPQTGKIFQWFIPQVEGLRVESGVNTGAEIGVHYDSMIAKLIMKAENRSEAIHKMRFVLENTVCLGVDTNIHYLIQILQNDRFINGSYDTGFVKNLVPDAPSRDLPWYLAAVLLMHRKQLLNQKNSLLYSGYRNVKFSDFNLNLRIHDEDLQISYQLEGEKIIFSLQDKTYTTQLLSVNESSIRVQIDDIQKNLSLFFDKKNAVYHVQVQGKALKIRLMERYPSRIKEKETGNYLSPMPGQIKKIFVKEGQSVKAGEPLMILVSMKMENSIVANQDEVVDSVLVEENQIISAQQLLVIMKESNEEI
jgi:acetyl/propionyl-CoA carboxylase alpha subunit